MRFEDAGVEVRGKGLIGGGAGLSDVVADVVGLVARVGVSSNCLLFLRFSVLLLILSRRLASHVILLQNLDDI